MGDKDLWNLRVAHLPRLNKCWTSIYGVKVILEFEVKLLGSYKRQSSVQHRMRSFTLGVQIVVNHFTVSYQWPHTIVTDISWWQLCIDCHSHFYNNLLISHNFLHEIGKSSFSPCLFICVTTLQWLAMQMN